MVEGMYINPAHLEPPNNQFLMKISKRIMMALAMVALMLALGKCQEYIKKQSSSTRNYYDNQYIGKDYYTSGSYRRAYYPYTNQELTALKDQAKKDFIPYDGKQNKEGYGSTNSQLERLGMPKYKDGISEPIDNMPNPRDVSNVVGDLKGPVPKNKRGISALFTFWGQFMDHDMGLTTEQEEDEDPEHLDIAIPKGDKIFDPQGTGTEIFEFRRTIFLEGSQPRQFPNVITSFIDANNVYGSDDKKSFSLRTYKNGEMKTSDGNFLPYDPEKQNRFIAGDIRVNENLGLTSLHTIFLREHNRRCEQINKIAPDLTDEEVYQLSRGHVVALLQKITVKDWLPILLGPKLYSQYMLEYYGYDASANPSLTLEFSTAAFRFGHSLLVSDHPQIDKWGNVKEVLKLTDMFQSPHMMNGDRLELMFRGLTRTHAKEKNCGIVDDIRNFLFLNPTTKIEVDLFSLNVQRQREHGLQGYNSMRYTLGLKPMHSYSDMTNYESARKLQWIYGYKNDCDLWVCLVCQNPVYGGVLGEVGGHIVGKVMKNVRNGDKFWYERYLDSYLLRQIQGTTLSDVIQRNTEITDLQKNVFIV